MRQSVRRICIPTTQTSSAKVPLWEYLRISPSTRSKNSSGTNGSVTIGSRAELLFIEERAGHILHLEKSISEKHDEVAFRYRTRCRRVDDGGEDSHGRAARFLAVELFGRSAVAPHMQRAGVPGVGETQFRPFHVGDNIKTGREH